MTSAPTIPGLDVQIAKRRELPSPLRSDVAGFVGRTKRGQVGMPLRVEGWRGYLAEFGGLCAELPLTYAIRGYFENGGEIAHIVRIAPENPPTAETEWEVGEGFVVPAVDAADGFRYAFRHRKYVIRASSPGTWGDGVEVRIAYRLGPDGGPLVDITVRAEDEPTERVRAIDPMVRCEDEDAGVALTMESRVSAESRLIRIEPDESSAIHGAPGGPPGLRRWQWPLRLRIPHPPSAPKAPSDRIAIAYVEAIERMSDEPEIAMTVMPGLYHDLPWPDPCRGSTSMRPVGGEQVPEPGRILLRAVQEAVRLQDRLVLVDVPHNVAQQNSVLQFAEAMYLAAGEDAQRRAAAIYHPDLYVSDPLGGPLDQLRRISPSGHVAGVIARLDRERGAHHTPANAIVYDAVDLEEEVPPDDGGLLYEAGVNLLRCRSGRGLTVWGGRTLDRSPGGRFLAHRRLIHRLVRAIRRVAEPIVFDPNNRHTWLTLSRAITTVLLEAFRSGALQGETPEQAFAVRCDERTNPPQHREQGLVVCEVDVAPAAPMEFITFRVVVSETGQVEVFDE